MRNIAYCLSLIYINMSSRMQCRLPAFLEYFIEKDSTSLGDEYLLKIVEYCASQVNNSKVVMGNQSRQKSKLKMGEYQNYVMQLLEEKSCQIWQQNLDKTPILDCFENWLELSYNKLLLKELPNSSLFQRILSACFEEEFSRSAVKCITTVIESMQSPEEDDRMFSKLLQIMCRVLPHIGRLRIDNSK